MDHRAAGIALLLSLSFAARASGEEVDSRRRVHLGAMIGLVSLPRPVDAEIFVTVVDLDLQPRRSGRELSAALTASAPRLDALTPALAD